MPQYVYLALVCGLRRHRVPAAPECNIGPQHMDRGPQCSPERRREEELVFPGGSLKRCCSQYQANRVCSYHNNVCLHLHAP